MAIIGRQMNASAAPYKTVIAVCGAQDPPPGVYEIAEAVGTHIARSGAVLVCGGLGGVMEAACKGAVREGGLTVGVLPGLDRREGNQWLTVAVATGTGHARNLAVVASADVVIAIDGEFGTLSEIAYALRIGRPVVGLDTWRIEPGKYNKYLERGEGIRLASTPADAVSLALELAEEFGRKTSPKAT